MSALRPHSPKLPHGLAAPRRARRTMRGGFTLVEVLAAGLLVGITLPVIMKGIAMSDSLASLTRHRTEAGGLAESKLNDLVAEGTWQSGSLSGDFGPEMSDYTWTGELQSWGTGQGVAGTNNVQQLDVHVFWNTAAGQRSITLSTLVYQSTNTSSTTGSSGTSTGGS